MTALPPAYYLLLALVPGLYALALAAARAGYRHVSRR